MNEPDELRVLVGVVGKPRGNRGEVYVEPRTDFPETRFRAPATLILEMPDGSGRFSSRPVKLEQSRLIGERLILKFEGVDTISDAETLRRGRLFAEGDEPLALAEGSYYHHQLLGLSVVSENGTRVGEVSGLMRTAAGDILEVRPAEGGADDVFLIPAIEEFCYDVDLSEGLVRVRLPEGLLEINR